MNIQMNPTEIKDFSRISHAHALKMIDSLLNVLYNKVDNHYTESESGLELGFGKFKGHANQHPLLNLIFLKYYNTCNDERLVGKKIMCIKFIRSITNWGFVDTKKFVETATNELGQTLF